MLNAILNSKSGRLSRDDEHNIRWKEIYRASEDLLTATIFERLSYLPPEIAWELLVSASGGQLPKYRLVEITNIEFWPNWSTEERARGVEPDVFIELELGEPAKRIHIIVESKHGGRQSKSQLSAEIQGWIEAIVSEEDERPDEIFVMAVGGLSSNDRRSKLRAEFDRVHEEMMFGEVKFSLILLDWIDLARAAAIHTPRNQNEDRVIKDMRQSLELCGYYHQIQPRQLEELIATRRINRGLTATITKMNARVAERIA